MKRFILKFLIVVVSISLVIAITVFYAIYISPSNLNISHRTISSPKIEKDMDDVTIAFVSDVHYGEFMDHDRLSVMIEDINALSPDVVLFGGDVFSDPMNIAASPDEVSLVSKLFASIKAPLGKFYVLGESDLQNEDAKTFVSTFLYNAGFENLTNKNVNLHNGTASFVSLVGIDSLVGGTPNVEQAFTNVNQESFTIVFTHVPDQLASINDNSCDLAFAGHSHGGQLSLPLIGALTSQEGTSIYERGQYDSNRLHIEISNGLGTSDVDMRLFSPPEVLVYRLNATTNTK
ncbi:MAG: metallophosphoesterase [Breznakia sp.]